MTSPAMIARTAIPITMRPITSLVLPGSQPTGMPIRSRMAATIAMLRSRRSTAEAVLSTGGVESETADGLVITQLYRSYHPFGEKCRLVLAREQREVRLALALEDGEVHLHAVDAARLGKHARLRLDLLGREHAPA